MPASSPAIDDDFLAHVRLSCVPGIGGRLRHMLLERFGSPQAVFAASPREIASVGRIGPTLAAKIPALVADRTAEEVIDICRNRGVAMLIEGAENYPALLSRIDDPPGVLFVRGGFEP